MVGRNFLILLVVSLCLFSCRKEESIEPLYDTEDIVLKDLKIEVPSKISPTVVEPSLVKKITKALGGWIPVVGDFIQLPVDITTALLPPLPSTSHPDVPQNTDLSNPKFLDVISKLTLNEAFIRVTPVHLRGPNYKPETCWFFQECPDVELNEFLSEVRVYLTFKQGQNSLEQSALDPEILLAQANTSKDYDLKNKTLYFEPTQTNLRPYLLHYKRFEVKIVASGRFPPRKVYIDGQLKIGFGIKLSDKFQK